jgi:hypothetical protein
MNREERANVRRFYRTCWQLAAVAAIFCATLAGAWSTGYPHLKWVIAFIAAVGVLTGLTTRSLWAAGFFALCASAVGLYIDLVETAKDNPLDVAYDVWSDPWGTLSRGPVIALAIYLVPYIIGRVIR